MTRDFTRYMNPGKKNVQTQKGGFADAKDPDFFHAAVCCSAEKHFR